MWDKAAAWLIAAHLLIMGLYLGLAVATTDWTAWQMRQWCSSGGHLRSCRGRFSKFSSSGATSLRP